MDYKEKLEKAKELYPTANADQRYVLESLFPELKESEDERIRKKFINLVKMSNEVGGFALHKWEADEMLAWLEKQDKQKLTWSEEDEKVRKALKEAGYEWSEETHDLKKIEQNLDWDEEDKEMIDNIIDYMKPMPIFFESTKGKSGKEYTQKFVKNAINWLKSLKERIGE